MAETFDRGPLQTYEITWKSGHVERIQAHQVLWPQQGVAMSMGGLGLTTEMRGESRILFHGEVGGRWLLVLSAIEEDVRTVRLVTVDEPIPGAGPVTS